MTASQIVDAMPAISSDRVADRNGKVLASSTLTPAASDVGMRIGPIFDPMPPVPRRTWSANAGAALGRLRNPFFTLSRRVRRPDALSCVISVAILPRIFEGIYPH